MNSSCKWAVMRQVSSQMLPKESNNTIRVSLDMRHKAGKFIALRVRIVFDPWFMRSRSRRPKAFGTGLNDILIDRVQSHRAQGARF